MTCIGSNVGFVRLLGAQMQKIVLLDQFFQLANRIEERRVKITATKQHDTAYLRLNISDFIPGEFEFTESHSRLFQVQKEAKFLRC